MNSSELFNILVDWNYWGNFSVQLKERPQYTQRMKALFTQRIALTLLGIRRAGKSSLIHLYFQNG